MRSSRRTQAYLALCTLLAPLAAQARLDSPTTALAEAYARSAVANARSPRGAASLVRLNELRDEVDDLNLLAQTYYTLASQRATEPLVRATAVQLAAEVERARGNMTKSAAMLEPLGFVQRYWVVGAFDNEGKSGCATDFGPEATTLSLESRYAAKERELGWRRLESGALDGYTDLSTVVRPHSEAVVYALALLETTEEGRANLGIGTSGAFRLWVNGGLALSEDRYNLPRPDQARVSVRLRKGLNRVLVKVCQENGPLGFYLRAERGEGLVSSPKAVLPETLPPLEKGAAPQPQALPTLAGLMEREVKANPKDALLRGEWASVLTYTRAFDEKEHADAVAAEKAVELAPENPELRLLAAQTERDDHNLRRKHLEAAVRADPTSPIARRMLAQHELLTEHPERALPLLEALVAEHPLYAAARLGKIRALEALGEWPVAVAQTEAAFRDLPHLPNVVREAARVSRRLDRQPEALERLRTAVALRFDDLNARKTLASMLADLSRVDEAAAQLTAVLVLDPFDDASRLKLAELLAANDRLADAQAVFADAKKLAPDDPEVYEREARSLLQASRRDEAVRSFRRALDLRPQNPALREVLRSLEGEEATALTRFALDPKPLIPEADAFAGEDAVTLVDSTYVRVQPSGLSSRTQQLAVKVYAQRGVDAFRSMPISYSPSRQEVRVLKARITKPDGAVIESYGEADRNLNEPWTGMYYDARAKVLTFSALSPGDLLEVQYRIDDTALDNLLSDYWGDVDYVQSTSPKLRYDYAVEMPAARALYWNRAQLPAGVVATQELEKDGRVLYRFHAQNLPKVVPEPSMPGWGEVATPLHVSTYQTWDQVGRYWWGLVRDQLTPNDELRRTVEKLLQGVDRKDDQAVLRTIYNFVVTNTRYVALEFGIHGFKPYRVDRVLARRFGDCKDKASLIVAMLKLAGVDSRLVLLRMRNLGAIADEPASLAAFNHAIAYVPKYQLFLDGTAEFHSARELPSADRVANVLVIEPDGKSSFFTTPEASAADNLTALSMDVALFANGSANAKGQSTVSGQSAPDYRRAYQAPATRKQTFEQGWAQTFPGLTVQQMSIGDVTRLDQDVQLSFQLAVPRYAEALPGGLRFHPFGSGKSYTQAYAPLTDRRFDLVLSGPWRNTFRFHYRLPAGYHMVDLPSPLVDENPFGKLSLSCLEADGQLTCDGAVGFDVARVKAADYPAFRAWLTRVDQAFSRKLLARATSGQTAER